MDSQVIMRPLQERSWADRLKKIFSFARMDASEAELQAMRLEAATTPISWTGDLNTQCTARWAGLLLRAEQKHRAHWSWTVYDAKTRAIIMDSRMSWGRAMHGKKARLAAEQAARDYLQADEE
jgi:hypothetical protein